MDNSRAFNWSAPGHPALLVGYPAVDDADTQCVVAVVAYSDCLNFTVEGHISNIFPCTFHASTGDHYRVI